MLRECGSKRPQIKEVISYLIKFLYCARFCAISSAFFISRFGSNTSFQVLFDYDEPASRCKLPQGLLLSGTQFIVSFGSLFFSILLRCPSYLRRRSEAFPVWTVLLLHPIYNYLTFCLQLMCKIFRIHLF